MKCAKSIRFSGLLMLITLLACGGLSTPGTAFTVIPQMATIAPNGTVKVAIIVANADVQSYHYSVEGGDQNGTINSVFNDPSRAIYTAPPTAGNYVVHAGFTQIGGEQHESNITITVQ